MILKLTEEEKAQQQEILRATAKKLQPIYSKLAKCMPGSAESADLSIKLLDVKQAMQNDLKDFNEEIAQNRVNALIKEGRQALIDSGKSQISGLVKYAFSAAENKKEQAEAEREQAKNEKRKPRKLSEINGSQKKDSVLFSPFDYLDFSPEYAAKDLKMPRWFITVDKESKAKEKPLKVYVYENWLHYFVFNEIRLYISALKDDEAGQQELDDYYKVAYKPYTKSLLMKSKTRTKQTKVYMQPQASSYYSIFYNAESVAVNNPQKLNSANNKMKLPIPRALLKPVASAKGYYEAIGKQENKAKYPEPSDSVIYSAVISLYEAGNTSFIPITAICNVVNGVGAKGRPTTAQINKTILKLLNMISCPYYYANADMTEAVFTTLLEGRIVMTQQNGNPTYCLELFNEPPLYLTSKETGQIRKWDLYVLDDGLNHNDLRDALGNMLLRLINMYDHNPQKSNKLKYETIYSYYKPGQELTRKQKFDARETTKDKLNYYKSIGLISGWKEYPDNKEIDYPEDKKRTIVTIKEGVTICRKKKETEEKATEEAAKMGKTDKRPAKK